MTRILRFGKRFALAALIAGILLVVAQVVLAAPPEASFTSDLDAAIPATGCRSVTFTSTSTDPENDPLTIEWSFGDGTTGTGSSVSHVYATPGSKHVTMTVSDPDTAGEGIETDTAEADITIPNAAPTADFAVPAAQAGQAVGFTANASDTDGTIASYAWDFGDAGATGTGANPTHTFNDHTAHDVSLIATDNCGQPSVAAVHSVTPGNTAPVVPAPTATVAGLPATFANPGDTVTFAVAATDANNDDLTYAWNFGDGTTGTGATPTHTYAATVTTANVTVQVTDEVNATTPSAQALAFRVNQAPVANFTNNPESPRVAESVTFNALTPGSASADPDGTIAKYEWDFGDGNWVQGSAAPTHVFTAVKDDVRVGLRVTDNNGRVSAPVHKLIDVNPTRPTAALRVEPANPLPGQTVTLTSTSVKDSQTWALPITRTEWDFDYTPTNFTANASGTKVTTSFATAGVHTVAVHVFDGSGGDDIAYKPIVVNARPRASFTVRPTTPREGSEVTFISTSSDPDGPIAKQEWDLDNDGRYDDGSGVVASTRKLKQGTRTVRLRVTDSKGATALTSQKVKVAAKPLTQPPDVTSTLGYARRAWGIQVVALYVTVPSHTTVKITCKGRGCPRGKFVKSSGKKKSTELRFKKFRGRLRAGAKITVISYRHGSIAEYFTWGVRGDYKPPLKRKRCKALTAQKYRACG